MRRLAAVLSATALVAVAITVLVAQPDSAAASATTTWTYYKDKFQEQEFDGNDASGQFSSDWIEVGEANGPLKGYASVSDHDYCYGYCLQLGGGELAVGNIGIERSLNLDGAIEAKLTYIFATDLYGGSTDQRIAVQISADGGGQFATLETYQLNDDEDMDRQDYIDISGWAAPQTVIRFVSLDGAPANVLLVDDFLVKALFYDGPPPPTTTTPPPTTTTTTPPPTTTTLPPTTTTTTPPPTTTTTTTLPPTTTTTTTLPPTTTTTTPPEDTTTTTTSAPLVLNGQLPPPGTDASYRTKDGLVVTDVARSQVPNDRRQRAEGSGPLGLLVTFRTTAESFTGSAIPSTLLGVLIAVLAVIGLSRGFKADSRES